MIKDYINFRKLNLNHPYFEVLSECFIDIHDSVYPCHSHGGDSVGNVIQKKFYKIWNSSFYQELRLQMRQRTPIWNCKGC